MATQTEIVREAPEIEAYKLGLLKSAKQLADQPITLPTQQIAEMSGLQQKAAAAADPGIGGIGGYQPFLTAGTYSLGDAYTALAPSGIGQFMNPFQQAISDEINRAYDIEAQKANLSAVGQAGGPSAFGGSRAAIQQAEIGTSCRRKSSS